MSETLKVSRAGVCGPLDADMKLFEKFFQLHGSLIGDTGMYVYGRGNVALYYWNIVW